MGTSGAFGGSGGKDARDLRHAIVDWLDDAPLGSPTPQGDQTPGGPPEQTGDQPRRQDPRPGIDIGPAIRVLLRGRGGGRSDGPGGGGGGVRGGGSGRSQGGASRSVGGISKAAGRAGRLALAYSAGDRAPLEGAGLNYEALLALGDPIAVGIKIVEAAFEAQPDSTIEDAEARDIVAAVVEWILESPADQAPTPDEVVRKTIETMIAEVTLTEVGDKIRSTGATYEARRSAETMVRDVAEEYARQVTLSSTGASEQEIAAAIENGIRELGRIFGVES